MIRILDATLREGEQTPGVYFDRHIKLAIAQLLDEIGVDIIEAGHPAVTPEIHSAVDTLSHQDFNAFVGAHSRSLQSDVELALECNVRFLGIFYCVSEDRLNGVFKKDISTAISQITSVIDYAKSVNPDLLIRYTPEDTVRSEFANVISVAEAAVKSGANIISVADTTGYMVPGTSRSMYDYIARLKDELAKRNCEPQIAVHCHNDRGLALANVLDAYRAGAEIIDSSVQGLGERAGIVDLAQLLVIFSTEFQQHNKWNLQKLPELYELVSKHSGVCLPANYPVMGDNAFTHCAGVHTHAAAVNPMHYESLNPELVGRKRNFSLDHMSGLASIRYALDLLETEVDQELEKEILQEVKIVGQRGRTVDLSELSHIITYLKQTSKKVKEKRN
ncbi:MAG: 2-isopropylmalate synthase [Rhodothermaceae bacterium]